MIEVKDLWKRYHNHHGSDWVLKDINLSIPKGVSVGLIGANGAGKSTLLRLIAGMDTPERGSVTRHSRVSWPIGLSGGVHPNMTGRQNAKFVGRAFGRSSAEIKRVIDYVQDFAEIGDAFDEPVRTYSSGMKSRLSFGLSLAFDFDVYISDEATAVGDRAFKEKAKALFKAKTGKASLIMVSHGEAMLRDLCQAGIYLKQCRAFWFDDINEAISAYHQDIEQNEATLSAGEILDSTPPEKLNAEQFKIARTEQRRLQQLVRGMGIAHAEAKQQEWPREQLAVLLKAHAEFKIQVNEISERLDKTCEGQRQLATQELNQSKNMVEALQASIERAEQDVWPVEECQVLDATLRIAWQRLSRAEAAMDRLNGTD